MSRPSLVSILAEDERHVRLIRRYLYQLGYSPHDIRIEDLPSGRGCGEQWVRERYTKAVNAYRARSSRATTALIVAIDADNCEVDRRLRQLQDVLSAAQMPARAGHEMIVHLIPKRSIETWILWLSARPVDELTDYRHETGIDLLINSAAETLHLLTRPHASVPNNCIPSLRSALIEITRLE